MLTLSYINTALSQSAFRIYKCYIIINNLSDYRDIETIASNKKIKLNKIHNVLNDVGKRSRYGYVLFDGSPRSYENTRVRTGILPREKTIVYECATNV